VKVHPGHMKPCALRFAKEPTQLDTVATYNVTVHWPSYIFHYFRFSKALYFSETIFFLLVSTVYWVREKNVCWLKFQKQNQTEKLKHFQAHIWNF